VPVTVRSFSFLHPLSQDYLWSSFLEYLFTSHLYADSTARLGLGWLLTAIRLVCRLWNAVIISTPSLWVRLHLGRRLNLFEKTRTSPPTSCPSGLNDQKHVLFISSSFFIKLFCSVFLSLLAQLSVGKAFNSTFKKNG